MFPDTAPPTVAVQVEAPLCVGVDDVADDRHGTSDDRLELDTVGRVGADVVADDDRVATVGSDPGPIFEDMVAEEDDFH